MYFCPKCNFILDITKNLSSQNINEISSIEDFIEKSLNDDLDNIIKLKFSKNELMKSSIFKKLDTDNQNLVTNKYNIFTNDNILNAYFVCDNCNYNTKLEAGTMIFKSSTANDVDDDDKFLKSRILDNTLPRTKDFICPNKKCDSKNVNDKSREAIFYRPDSNKYNLKYVCCTCLETWNP
jgi:hypothetical protein